MYDLKNSEWVVDGEAVSIDAIFRTRDHLADQAYVEMKKAGYFPTGEMPEVEIGHIDGETIYFTFRWKCERR